MLINGRHTHCLHVPFLFHWQIYGQQPSSTSSPRDKRKKAEWTSKKQTSVDDVKNKTSILNRITIVFHHCLFNLNISVETNYVWVSWFVWNTRSFPQRSYLEKCVSNTVIYRETSFIKKKCHVHELLSLAVLLSISENISTSSAILNSRTLSPKLGHVNENLNSDWLVVCFGRGYQIW